MTFLEYLSILRRRWYYLAIGVLAGAVGGFLTAPGTADAPDQFTATNTLLVDSSTPSGANLNLAQAALLADTGPVPLRVDARLADEGVPEPSDVSAEADLELRSLAVTATSSSKEAAARAADLTAEEINAELARVDREVYEQLVANVEEQITQSEERRASLVAQLAPLAPEDPLRSPILEERDTVDKTLLDLRSQLQQLRTDGTPSPPLKVLEEARGKPAAGFKLPTSRPARALMLGILGLLLGVVGALVADRLDTRVRGKEDAERAFELPVIAEIPPMAQSGGTRGRELVVATRPASPFVESYRALRTVVLFAATEAAAHAVAANGHGNGTNGNGSAPHGDSAPESAVPHRAQVVLVTSPSAGEGKTTTAAHLAAVLAEAGRRTLVISADFRRPRIHEYFGVAREPGLSDVLESGSGRVRLSDLQMTTSFEGVHLMPSGGPVDNPAQLLAESADLIEAARQLFDYVVIDTPPLLVANDATELAAAADVVIMVAKADRTSRNASRRAAEILRRVDAPVLGVVISAAHDTPTAYGYYRYRYYSDTDQGSGSKKRLSRKQKAEPAPAGVAVGPNLDVDED
jgi:capsular exopolysaccharide synthesis family protein